jgi:hypothetical protein
MISRFAVLTWLFLSCATEPPDPAPDISQEIDIVSVVGRIQTTHINRPATLLQLQLTAVDLVNPRAVEVRIIKPSVPTKGALVLATGGFGSLYYGTGPQTNTTLDNALNLGLETFEIRWSGDRGWGTGVAGIGYPKAVRGFGAIVRHLKKNEMVNPSLVVAHGGSGGSFQIAYGLTRYNLESDIDYAILIAGPPTADLPQAIFGNSRLKSYWPPGLGGLSITDYILGWENNGDYCKKRELPPRISC